LAEAITGQLTSVGGGGVILAGYVGVLSVSANNVTPLTVAHFPALASITGMTVTMLGDPLGWLVESGVPVAGVTQQLRLVPLRNRAPAYSGNVTVYALAWGPPK
jgi:hypothetical protein